MKLRFTIHHAAFIPFRGEFQQLQLLNRIDGMHARLSGERGRMLISSRSRLIDNAQAVHAATKQPFV